MAYMTITRISGDPEHLLRDYGEITDTMDRVGEDHGLIIHAGAQTPDGLLIVNVWPSQEASEAAAGDPRRLAVLERVGLAPEQVWKEHHEAERCFAPGLAAVR